MTKTITASFLVPATGQFVRIDLADTDGIKVGDVLRIGFDHYTITLVDGLGVTVFKCSSVMPAGLECWIMRGSD
jgi:hypothetical protein